ncbi:MAG: hypothetical protein MRQ09_03575 [Candidatus Midichloria sp.]|nr:hypothetical protein [Candidatus Midichloria sp.]
MYNESIATIIHQFKYEDKTHYIKVLNKFLVNALPYIDKNIDLVVPVPLHRSRLK